MPEPPDLDAFLIDGEEEPPEPTIQAPGSAVQTPKPRRTYPGRKSKRNAATIEKIVTGVANGLPLRQACSGAGVSYSTLHRWRSGPGGQDIAAQLERADAGFIEHHLAIIRQAAEKGTWVASAWLLERKFPESFGRRLQTERHIDQRISIENSEEELRAFERRMEELIPNEADRKAFAIEVLRLGAPEGNL